MIQIKFFAVPVFESGEQEEALNAFLRSHRIVAVERQLMKDPEGTYWCIAVQWNAGGSESNGRDRGRPKAKSIDYREVLDAATFAIFDEFRKRRREIAAAEGVPLYEIFRNDQLADFATRRCKTPEALESTQGVGKATVRKYGERLLANLDIDAIAASGTKAAEAAAQKSAQGTLKANPAQSPTAAVIGNKGTSSLPSTGVPAELKQSDGEPTGVKVPLTPEEIQDLNDDWDDEVEGDSESESTDDPVPF